MTSVIGTRTVPGPYRRNAEYHRVAALLSMASATLLISCGGGSDPAQATGEGTGETPPGSILLGWDAVPAPTLDSYRVYYGTDSGSYVQQLAVGKATRYTVTGLSSGTRYYFTVTAVDGSGAESIYSNEVFADVN